MKQNAEAKMAKQTHDIVKKLFILAALLFPTQARAQDVTTEINGAFLYSEYHSSPQSEFKGTIIFQNGSGTSLKAWTENKTFFKCIKQSGSTFMYDRSGVGQSPPDFSISAEQPITAERVNSKLMRLLERNQIKPPYILVSHSYGGLYAGYFARKYPDLVVGMLMIDPVPSNYEYSNQILEQFEATREKLKNTSSKEAYQLDDLEILRQGNLMTADSYYQQLGFDTTKDQVSDLPEMNSRFPITIISSSGMDKNSTINGDWHTLQKQWLNQNPQSMIFKAIGGHFLQLDRPNLICKELNKLVKLAIKSSESN